MLHELLKQLHGLIEQSSIFDDELLTLIFDNESQAKHAIDTKSFKQQLSQFLAKAQQDLSDKEQALQNFGEQQIKSSEQSPSSQLSLSDFTTQLESYLQRYADATQHIHGQLDECQQQQTSLVNEHKDSLITLYEEIDLHYELHAKFNELINALSKAESPQHLLANIESMILLLLKSINSDKENSKFFLKNIHQEIEDITKINQQSQQIANITSKQRKVWDKDAQKNLTNLTNLSTRMTLSATDKQKLTNEVTILNSAFDEKIALDKKTLAAQQAQINQLSEKLMHIEKEADSYRSQLVEQKLLNMQDSLTQLPNRKALENKFEASFTQAQQSNKSLWVAVADIDHFKVINDTYGHSAGDKTLQVIASSLNNSLRDSEFIARFGGEEFVFLIPDLTNAAITNILNRVRERIKAIPFKFKNENVQITISIGATKIKPTDKKTKTSFDRADNALYQAKKQGRDRVIIY